MEERINLLENKFNILNNQFNDVKNNVNSIENKLDIINKISTNEINHNNNSHISMSYSDQNGSLNNESNPFIIAQNKSQKKNDMDIESKQNSKDSISVNSRNKYKPRDPLYYYYKIDNKTY